MNETRRNLMKGMLAASVLGVSGFPASGLAMDASSGRNLAVLLNGSAADTLFAQGVQLGLAGFAQAEALHLETMTIFNVPAMRAWLKGHQGLRVAGLLDEAGYLLFSMLAQDGGSSLLLEKRAEAGQSADSLGRALGCACLRGHEGREQNSIQGKSMPADAGGLAGLVSFLIDI